MLTRGSAASDGLKIRESWSIDSVCSTRKNDDSVNKQDRSRRQREAVVVRVKGTKETWTGML